MIKVKRVIGYIMALTVGAGCVWFGLWLKERERQYAAQVYRFNELANPNVEYFSLSECGGICENSPPWERSKQSFVTHYVCYK